MDRNELIQRTFPYLLKRLEDAGINATPQVDPQTNGYILTVDTMRFNVENLLSDLSRSDPSQHQERIERWVAFMIETQRMPEKSVNDPDELRRRIRTRIIRDGQSSDLPITYIRPFTAGLAKALYLDFPNSVSLVTDQSLRVTRFQSTSSSTTVRSILITSQSIPSNRWVHSPNFWENLHLLPARPQTSAHW